MGDKTKKFERKHFFINRRLQGRYMLTFLIPMLVMLLFMLFTLYFASQTVVNATTSTIKQGIQDKETVFFQDNQSPSVESYRLLLADIKGFIRDYSSDTSNRKVVLSTLLWVFGTGILLVIVQIVLLTIYFSHKVAGPIYRFERMCHGLIEGDYTGGVFLRKGDEMQTLASLLNEVVGKTRTRMNSIINEQDEAKKKEIISGLKL